MRRRNLLLGLLLLVVIVPAGALPLLLLANRSDPSPTTQAAPETSGSRVPTAAATTGLGIVVTAPGASTPQAPPGTRPGSRPPTAPSSPPAPVHLILEAEAGSPMVSLMRATVEPVEGASGGGAARFTGTPGRVRFHSVAVTSSGTYRVTIWYAPGEARSGSVQGTDGQVPITFAAGGGCCAQVVAMVPVAAGGTITIRLSGGGGGYPAVDRIAVDTP